MKNKQIKIKILLCLALVSQLNGPSLVPEPEAELEPLGRAEPQAWAPAALTVATAQHGLMQARTQGAHANHWQTTNQQRPEALLSLPAVQSTTQRSLEERLQEMLDYLAEAYLAKGRYVARIKEIEEQAQQVVVRYNLIQEMLSDPQSVNELLAQSDAHEELIRKMQKQKAELAEGNTECDSLIEDLQKIIRYLTYTDWPVIQRGGIRGQRDTLVNVWEEDTAGANFSGWNNSWNSWQLNQGVNENHWQTTNQQTRALPVARRRLEDITQRLTQREATQMLPRRILSPLTGGSLESKKQLLQVKRQQLDEAYIGRSICLHALDAIEAQRPTLVTSQSIERHVSRIRGQRSGLPMSGLLDSQNNHRKAVVKHNEEKSKLEEKRKEYNTRIQALEQETEILQRDIDTMQQQARNRQSPSSLL